MGEAYSDPAWDDLRRERDEAQAEVERLRADRDRLREALAWYADPANWMGDPEAWERAEAGDDDPETLEDLLSAVECDAGKRARAALGEDGDDG